MDGVFSCSVMREPPAFSQIPPALTKFLRVPPALKIWIKHIIYKVKQGILLTSSGFAYTLYYKNFFFFF